MTCSSGLRKPCLISGKSLSPPTKIGPVHEKITYYVIKTGWEVYTYGINLILPQVPRKQKCGIITMLVSSYIGLAYEGISSFQYHKRNKALHKGVKAMDSKANIKCNKLMQLENSMPMYGIYNTETLEKLIKTVHDILNTTYSHERLFVGKQRSLTIKSLYAHCLGLHHYSINSLSYLRTIQDK